MYFESSVVTCTDPGMFDWGGWQELLSKVGSPTVILLALVTGKLLFPGRWLLCMQG